MQKLDVYRDAAEHNVIVVGGQARTVGAAGGWATGGGHSPLAHFYGLGVDSESFSNHNLSSWIRNLLNIKRYPRSEPRYSFGGVQNTQQVQ